MEFSEYKLFIVLLFCHGHPKLPDVDVACLAWLSLLELLFAFSNRASTLTLSRWEGLDMDEKYPKSEHS